MEEEDTKQCPNCKREIPSVNFTTHSVHCARNVRTCPVCKEPVPLAQLQQHHDAMHKEVPCKKCGESVCGTDLEDHVRDSCAQTIKPCRYCELELPREALPAHEAYCGARSEQCPECHEYVMAKYRQLHLDSNHGFIRLDDDPAPKEAKPKLTNGFAAASTSRQHRLVSDNVRPNRPDNFRPITDVRFDAPSSSNVAGMAGVDRVANDRAGVANRTGNDRTGLSGVDRVANDRAGVANRAGNDRTGLAGVANDRVGVANRVGNDRAGMDNRVANDRVDRMANVDNRVERNGKVTVKRTNDQPQINTSVEPREKVHKDLPSLGAVKKRPAPPPPEPRRDLPYWSAQRRAQDEERKRQEQTAYNLSVGLPPVLSPAAKLDKLRKMDALHNREVEEEYRGRLQGRVWQPREARAPGDDLSHLQPMTAQQFMDRFQELQLGADLGRPAAGAAGGGAGGAGGAGAGGAAGGGARGAGAGGGAGGGARGAGAGGAAGGGARGAGAGGGAGGGARGAGGAGGDRFSEIKSSLRELRRGLNEVTAPYNSASSATNNTHIDSSRVRAASPPAELPASGEELLPCEFCAAPVPAEDLVLHQTGCRPDLTQYKPRKSSRSRSPRPRPRSPSPAEPVIPCEFCAESLPVYLISEHQERCGREANLLYPD